jgi:hypothetical protein
MRKCLNCVLEKSCVTILFGIKVVLVGIRIFKILFTK